MKKTIVFFLSFSRIVIAVSQPTATISNHISPGTYFSTSMVDSNFHAGGSGMNQYWNFQNIIPKSPFQYDTVEVRMSAGSYYSSLFPLASHAVHSYYFQSYNNSYDYYNVTGTKVEWLGYVDSIWGIKLVCSDNLTERQVPLDFDSSFVDMYAYARIPPTYSVHGSANVSYDGYGTLRLPNTVVINNSYRIKTDQLAIDSNASNTDTFNIITYTWYDPAKNFPVLIFKQAFFQDSETGRWLYYNTLSPLNGVSEMIQEPLFKLMPNPVTNQVTLNFSKSLNGTVSIFDTMGTQFLSDMIHNEPSHQINISRITPGIYFIHVSSGTEYFVEKIVKTK